MTIKPKFILIAVAQLDCTSGDGVTAHARAFTTEKEAAEWLQGDYNTEAEWHDWTPMNISEKDIYDGMVIRSPAGDSDHDYAWKVIFQY